MKNIKKKTAFSLIELSIVGLIIGIIMSGLFASKVMLQQSKVANARSLTTSSPVEAIGDLMLWYETTLEQSFTQQTTDDGTAVSTWYDLNPDITTYRNNATQTTSANQPTYKENVINGLPVVRFDGTDDFLSFKDNDKINNENYTIFVVERRTSSDTDNYFIGGTDSGSGEVNLHLGYRTDSTLTYAQDNTNYYDISHTAYSTPTTKVHSYTFNFIDKTYYIDGSLQTLSSAGSPSATNALSSFTGGALGRYQTDYYKGDIGEVIIFKKQLSTNDRKAVEHYLGKKWGIDIS